MASAPSLFEFALDCREANYVSTRYPQGSWMFTVFDGCSGFMHTPGAFVTLPPLTLTDTESLLTALDRHGAPELRYFRARLLAKLEIAKSDEAEALAEAEKRAAKKAEKLANLAASLESPPSSPSSPSEQDPNNAPLF